MKNFLNEKITRFATALARIPMADSLGGLLECP
jgi:hypothetical protein